MSVCGDTRGGFWDRPCMVDVLCATNDLISCLAPELGSQFSPAVCLLWVQTATRCPGNVKVGEERVKDKEEKPQGREGLDRHL